MHVKTERKHIKTCMAIFRAQNKTLVKLIGKIIKEAYDSFMHAPLGLGGYRFFHACDIAQLVELRSCNWVVVITGWMSNCPCGNDSIFYLNWCLAFFK